METRTVTCIICPVGCSVKVDVREGQAMAIRDNRCLRGQEYAVAEATDPRRVLTTTVCVLGAKEPLVAVRTAQAIPKGKLANAMEELKNLVVTAPIGVGEVVVDNLAHTGVAVVATRGAEKLSGAGG